MQCPFLGEFDVFVPPHALPGMMVMDQSWGTDAKGFKPLSQGSAVQNREEKKNLTTAGRGDNL